MKLVNKHGLYGAALISVICFMPIQANSATVNPAVDSKLPSKLEIIELASDRGISQSEALTRLNWQSELTTLNDWYSKELGADYAGVWVDTSDGDRIKIGVVNRGDALRKASSSADKQKFPDSFDMVPVRFSIQELKEANDWISNEIVGFGKDVALSVGLRTDTNTVELTLPSHRQMSEPENELVERAKALLGDKLSISYFGGVPETVGCFYPYCDPSLRGGNKIRTDSGKGCTNAFVARSKVDNKLYQFTAGHCVVNTTESWYTKFSDLSKHYIGPRHNYIFGPEGDMAILRINNVPGWNPENWVHVTAGPDTTVNEEYEINSEGSSFIGMRICTTGAVYGNSNCGEVTKLGVTVNYVTEGVIVKNLGQANYCAVKGDSGGPLYASHTAYGLISGGILGVSPCVSFYQGILGAESKMNVNVLH
ncbi:MAG: S1 family peptidase [Gammaproteobacteria bacterium]|nr:S1 family peptidase [Gammaproteobacteria bacterium]